MYRKRTETNSKTINFQMKGSSPEGVEGIRQLGLFGRQSAQNLHHSDVSVASRAGELC